MKKTKRYEDGGFTFADDVNTKEGIAQALADIEARGKAQGEDYVYEGSESEETPKAARSVAKPKAESPRKVEKAAPKAEEKPKSEAPKVTGKDQVEVKASQSKSDSRSMYPDLPRPKSAESAKSAMPDIAARKAATAARARRSSLPEGQKFMGMKSGGVASASKRADGCAVRGKTKGRMV
jgi:hypothetical protein